ncbi:MAG: hypothetical protein ACREVY_01975 [Gammaproteobacteria bacterium]
MGDGPTAQAGVVVCYETPERIVREGSGLAFGIGEAGWKTIRRNSIRLLTSYSISPYARLSHERITL